MGSNPPVGGEGEQKDMRVYERDLVQAPIPALLRDGSLLYLPGKGWFRFDGNLSSGCWQILVNPDVEPYWGDPLNRWTPLKKGERVQIIGGEHFVNWLGSAQGEMVDGTEQVIVDGKDSPWSFSPKYLVRVQDLTDAHLEATVKGTFSNMADEPIEMGPGHVMHSVPDTDYEHELAAGVYGEDEVNEHKQIVLALPIKAIPPTEACHFIFGDEINQAFLVDWCMQFIKKQMDYGDSANDLGMEGQYAELHRKIGKLRRAMWEGKPLVNEGLEEVLMDLIGHCFLSLLFLKRPSITRYKKGSNK
jgi:hypothetical protein